MKASNFLILVFLFALTSCLKPDKVSEPSSSSTFLINKVSIQKFSSSSSDPSKKDSHSGRLRKLSPEQKDLIDLKQDREDFFDDLRQYRVEVCLIDRYGRAVIQEQNFQLKPEGSPLSEKVKTDNRGCFIFTQKVKFNVLSSYPRYLIFQKKILGLGTHIGDKDFYFAINPWNHIRGRNNSEFFWVQKEEDKKKIEKSDEKRIRKFLEKRNKDYRKTNLQAEFLKGQIVQRGAFGEGHFFKYNLELKPVYMLPSWDGTDSKAYEAKPGSYFRVSLFVLGRCTDEDNRKSKKKCKIKPLSYPVTNSFTLNDSSFYKEVKIDGGEKKLIIDRKIFLLESTKQERFILLALTPKPDLQRKIQEMFEEDVSELLKRESFKGDDQIRDLIKEEKKDIIKKLRYEKIYSINKTNQGSLNLISKDDTDALSEDHDFIRDLKKVRDVNPDISLLNNVCYLLGGQTEVQQGHNTPSCVMEHDSYSSSSLQYFIYSEAENFQFYESGTGNVKRVEFEVTMCIENGQTHERVNKGEKFLVTRYPKYNIFPSYKDFEQEYVTDDAGCLREISEDPNNSSRVKGNLEFNYYQNQKYFTTLYKVKKTSSENDPSNQVINVFYEINPWFATQNTQSFAEHILTTPDIETKSTYRRFLDDIKAVRGNPGSKCSDRPEFLVNRYSFLTKNIFYKVDSDLDLKMIREIPIDFFAKTRGYALDSGCNTLRELKKGLFLVKGVLYNKYIDPTVRANLDFARYHKEAVQKNEEFLDSLEHDKRKAMEKIRIEKGQKDGGQEDYYTKYFYNYAKGFYDYLFDLFRGDENKVLNHYSALGYPLWRHDEKTKERQEAAQKRIEDYYRHNISYDATVGRINDEGKLSARFYFETEDPRIINLRNRLIFQLELLNSIKLRLYNLILEKEEEDKGFRKKLITFLRNLEKIQSGEYEVNREKAEYEKTTSGFTNVFDEVSFQTPSFSKSDLYFYCQKRAKDLKDTDAPVSYDEQSRIVVSSKKAYCDKEDNRTHLISSIFSSKADKVSMSSEECVCNLSYLDYLQELDEIASKRQTDLFEKKHMKDSFYLIDVFWEIYFNLYKNFGYRRHSVFNSPEDPFLRSILFKFSDLEYFCKEHDCSRLHQKILEVFQRKQDVDLAQTDSVAQRPIFQQLTEQILNKADFDKIKAPEFNSSVKDRYDALFEKTKEERKGLRDPYPDIKNQFTELKKYLNLQSDHLLDYFSFHFQSRNKGSKSEENIIRSRSFIGSIILTNKRGTEIDVIATDLIEKQREIEAGSLRPDHLETLGISYLRDVTADGLLKQKIKMDQEKKLLKEVQKLNYNYVVVNDLIYFGLDNKKALRRFDLNKEYVQEIFSKHGEIVDEEEIKCSLNEDRIHDEKCYTLIDDSSQYATTKDSFIRFLNEAGIEAWKKDYYEIEDEEDEKNLKLEGFDSIGVEYIHEQDLENLIQYGEINLRMAKALCYSMTKMLKEDYRQNAERNCYRYYESYILGHNYEKGKAGKISQDSNQVNLKRQKRCEHFGSQWIEDSKEKNHYCQGIDHLSRTPFYIQEKYFVHKKGKNDIFYGGRQYQMGSSMNMSLTHSDIITSSLGFSFTNWFKPASDTVQSLFSTGGFLADRFSPQLFSLTTLLPSYVMVYMGYLKASVGLFLAAVVANSFWFSQDRRNSYRSHDGVMADKRITLINQLVSLGLDIQEYEKCVEIRWNNDFIFHYGKLTFANSLKEDSFSDIIIGVLASVSGQDIFSHLGPEDFDQKEFNKYFKNKRIPKGFLICAGKIQRDEPGENIVHELYSFVSQFFDRSSFFDGNGDLRNNPYHIYMRGIRDINVFARNANLFPSSSEKMITENVLYTHLRGGVVKEQHIPLKRLSWVYQKSVAPSFPGVLTRMSQRDTSSFIYPWEHIFTKRFNLDKNEDLKHIGADDYSGSGSLKPNQYGNFYNFESKIKKDLENLENPDGDELSPESVLEEDIHIEDDEMIESIQESHHP